MKPLDGCGYPLGAIRRLARPDPDGSNGQPDVIHHSPVSRSQAADVKVLMVYRDRERDVQGQVAALVAAGVEGD